MAWRIKQMEDGKMKFVTHADHPFNDYTLCGMALEGMGRAEVNEEHSAAEPINGKINCPLCISTIKHCKAIKL